MQTTAIEPGQTFLFIGDSITECGRRDAQYAPFGCGYVKRFIDLQTANEPGKSIRFFNHGISGNTAEDLYSRWTDDVLLERPDWVSVKIGVNDANRYTSDPKANPDQSPEAHRRFLKRCLERTREPLPEVKLLLITPFFLSRDDCADAYRGRLCHAIKDYHQNVRELAEEFGARLLDTQALFNSFIEHHRPSEISHDYIHLNELGAMILGKAVYDVMAAK